MSRKTVEISLSPGRLTVALGERCANIDLEEQLWETAWSEGLRPLDKPLTDALTELGVPGADGLLVYRSPTAIAEVFSYPVKAGAAEEAAALALADALGRPLEQCTWSLQTLSATTRPTVQTVILAAGDIAATAEVIEQWTRRAGVRLVHAEPADARALALVAGAVRCGPGGACRAVLRMDDAGSVFAAGSGERLAFVRCVGIGLDQFVEALTRPIPRKGGVAGPAQLGRAKAREILMRVGVPEPAQIVDEALGIRGGDLLPLMQPALQRLLIEIKQSLRFGLDDAERTSLMIGLDGPGAAIPGLAATIASAVDRPVAPCAPPTKPLKLRRMSTLAPSAREAIAMRRASVALRAGAVGAAALIAFETFSAVRREKAIGAEIAAIEIDAERAGEAIASAEAQRSVAAALTDAQAKLDASFGRRTDWMAFLRELAVLTPESVRFTEIAGSYESGLPMASLHGVAWFEEADTDASGEGPITRYLDALRASPLVDRVELGETQRSDFEGRPARRFSLRVSLVGGAEWEFPGQLEPAP